jgi:hypothetical protein
MQPLDDLHAGLIVGHPGHELRVDGWLTQTPPVVHVLTDGSGDRGASRIDSTSALRPSRRSSPPSGRPLASTVKASRGTVPG